MAERIILGIDPGTNLMGYGIIEIIDKNLRYIDMGVVDLKKITDHYLSLSKIFEHTIKLIDNYKPDELAIEAQFFGKNIQSMLKLGRAQGVAIAAALSRHIPVFEYAPRKIKMSITGNGNASKEQVAGMLKHTLNFTDIPDNLDATDALGVAVCHFYQFKPSIDNTSCNTWKEFMNKNPGRVKNKP